MKKYIIIAGVPRAGKSTLTYMIVKKFGYQHICFDTINYALEQNMIEPKINTNDESLENTKYISSVISKFINSIIASGEYNEQEYGVVIDVCQLMPEDYVKNIAGDNCDIYYLVTSEVDSKKRFELLKKYDRPSDYTYYDTDEQKQKKCERIVETSKYIKEKCEEYSLKCYDTLFERENKFKEIIEDIRNN